MKFLYIYSSYFVQKIIKYREQKKGNKIEIKMADGHLSFKPRRDDHPIQERKNEVKIAKNNTFHVVNHETHIGICKDAIVQAIGNFT